MKKGLKSAFSTLLALLLIATLSLSLTACGDDKPPVTDTPPETATPSEPEETETPEPTPPQTDVDWNAIYLNWELSDPTNYIHPEKVRFKDVANSFDYIGVRLIDVNGDGVPELEMDPANAEISYPYVYTIVDGKVELVASGASIYKYVPTGKKVVVVNEGEDAYTWFGTDWVYDQAFYFLENAELVKAYEPVTIFDTGINEIVDQTADGEYVFDFDPVEELMQMALKHGYSRPTDYKVTETKYPDGGYAQAYYLGKRNIPYEEYDAMLESIGGEFSFDLDKVDRRKTVSDVEGEVKRIRAIWDDIAREVTAGGLITKVSVRRGVTALWILSPGGDGWPDQYYLERIDVAAGTDDIAYSRVYLFRGGFPSTYTVTDDDAPIFSFWSGKEDSHRLYFKDGYLFRWRYTAPNGKATDYDNVSYNSEFLQHEREARKEANALLKEALKAGPPEIAD
ncbi:MAG: hypothetical protein LBO63_02505 [Oscillospiraceae bacterium]|jgi:predicted small lipoprotein YifL|nr:hypothetical protein [Oscillospiraceae bacterium]